MNLVENVNHPGGESISVMVKIHGTDEDDGLKQPRTRARSTIRRPGRLLGEGAGNTNGEQNGSEEVE